ncbi:hypothetical protein ES332_A02G127700v1 [Gossypium tomentosum]|uniref:Uncharacterized protein n=1 Tax=Gossypium tomentosum TaxID=34277 RepID=A0A5D2RHU7_GOSTO|nr:hypothetical protein ES332_A02G127700v1 [Gossypium tomentosum]
MALFGHFPLFNPDLESKHSKKLSIVERNRENHSVSSLPISQKGSTNVDVYGGCTRAVPGVYGGCLVTIAVSDSKGNPRVSRRFNLPGPFGTVLELGY